MTLFDQVQQQYGKLYLEPLIKQLSDAILMGASLNQKFFEFDSFLRENNISYSFREVLLQFLLKEKFILFQGRNGIYVKLNSLSLVELITESFISSWKEKQPYFDKLILGFKNDNNIVIFVKYKSELPAYLNPTSYKHSIYKNEYFITFTEDRLFVMPEKQVILSSLEELDAKLEVFNLLK